MHITFKPYLFLLSAGLCFNMAIANAQTTTQQTQQLHTFSNDYISNKASTKGVARYSKCRTLNKESPTPYCFKKGDSGRLISILVGDLTKAGYYKGKRTSRFDSNVEKAVIKFQKDYRAIDDCPECSILKADAVVDANTLVRLCQAVGRGCRPDDTHVCYTGSPVLVGECLDKYK